jgi:hypothetical protein
MEPPADAEAQPDGSRVQHLPDGGSLRFTQRGDGSWRKPERTRGAAAAAADRIRGAAAAAAAGEGSPGGGGTPAAAAKRMIASGVQKSDKESPVYDLAAGPRDWSSLDAAAGHVASERRKASEFFSEAEEHGSGSGSVSGSGSGLDSEDAGVEEGEVVEDVADAATAAADAGSVAATKKNSKSKKAKKPSAVLYALPRRSKSSRKRSQSRDRSSSRRKRSSSPESRCVPITL